MPLRFGCTLTACLLGASAMLIGPASPVVALPQGPETIGGGSVLSPAVGPPPSYGIGGPHMVLVKNWHFGRDGTIKDYAGMSAEFLYHDQFGSLNNGGNYGATIVSPDHADAVAGQPIEGINCPPVRQFTQDSLKTFLVPLNGAAKVQPWNHNTGCGSFTSKWHLTRAGSLLGRDIVWETRVRYVTPPYFWFALWTAGNKWLWDGQAQGAEQDLIESFGYDNGGGNTNYDGRFWHSNAVASPSKDTVDYGGWGTAMAGLGIKSYDATQYHTWTWLYRRDDTYAMYVDGVRVQGGKDYHWTYGDRAGEEPINMSFLFDMGWGHNKIGSVDKELPASAFDGKYYEINYSRVYLSGDGETPTHGAHVLPGTVRASDFDGGGPGAGYHHTAADGVWRRYTVRVPASGRYQFRFKVAAPGGGTFHVEDEDGDTLTGAVAVPPVAGGKLVSITAPAAGDLSAGPHTLKWVQDKGEFSARSLTVTQAAGPTAMFVRSDSTTQGNWKGVYGADGYMIAGDATKQPAYGSVTKTEWEFTWNGSTPDVRALEKVDGTDRVAGQWGSNTGTYDIDCDFTDGARHRVALYGVDWDMNGRAEDIQVLDAATGGVLDTREITAYADGKYLVWDVRGHVLFRVHNVSQWTNPALSGIFFGPVSGAARTAHGGAAMKGNPGA